jgi:hypothetical protein
MVDAMNIRRAALLAWPLALLPAAAMNDPTLPPPALRASGPQPAASSGVAASTGLRLQGLRPGASAVIDGRLRRVGEQWQGYQLLRADAQVAWLRDPEGQLLRLSLLPEKKKP